MTRRTKIIIAAVSVLSLVVLCAGGGMVASRMRASAKSVNTTVRLAHPERGDLVEFVNAPGQVEPLNKVSISAKVAARVIELPFEEGDSVAAGDVIVRLDSTDLEAMLASTKASRDARAAEIEVSRLRIAADAARLEGTKATLAKAEADLQRSLALGESSDTSQADIDAAATRCEELRAGLTAAEHSLASARKNIEVQQYYLAQANAQVASAEDSLSYTVIKSPIDGVITRINTKVGELAVVGTLNNPSTLLLEVADLSEMLLVAEIDESDIGDVKKGQHAVARIHAYRDEEFTGTVESIALTHDLKAGSVKYFKTKIRLDTGDKRIYSGLTADVDIETTRHENVIKIPSQSVLARTVDQIPLEIRDANPGIDMNKTYTAVVYRFVDGKAVITPVETGESDATHTIIEAGLDESDRIVVGPYKILDGLSHEQKLVDEREAEEAEEKQSPPAKEDTAEDTSSGEDTSDEAQEAGGSAAPEDD